MVGQIIMVSIKKSLPFLLGFLLTLTLLWPLFAAPIFSHHDDVSIIRLHQMIKCFEDFQIPCRWVPDLGGLYGYPLFNYYAPLPYYFGALIYFLTGSLLFSVKTMLAVSFVGSFIFMYLFASKFWGKLGGSLSAIFYSFVPYHALDFYVRGAMGEMWGLMFFPAILWATVRLVERSNISNLLLLGFFIAALLTSHNLSAMIFLPIAIVWTAVLFFKKGGRKFLVYYLLSFILAFLLSSFYILPASLEKNLVHVDTTTFGYFGYTEHFKGIRELFIRRDWGFGASIREIPGGEEESISFQIGWIHLLGWGLSLFAAKTFWKKNKRISLVILATSAVILLAIFMVHPRSLFIWQMIEPLKYLQFPWRFLMIVIIFISFTAGSFVLLFTKNRVTIVWLVLVGLVILMNFSYFKPEKLIFTNDNELLKGENWDRQIKRSILDYLPIYAKEPPAELAKGRLEILTGDAKVSDFGNGSNWFKFNVEIKEHTIIRISQYYFPDWKIFVDGKEANVEYKNNSLGLMTIILGEGNHNVWGRLFDTPIRIVANMISLVSFLLFVSLIILQFKKVKGWLEYYRKRIS